MKHTKTTYIATLGKVRQRLGYDLCVKKGECVVVVFPEERQVIWLTHRHTNHQLGRCISSYVLQSQMQQFTSYLFSLYLCMMKMAICYCSMYVFENEIDAVLYLVCRSLIGEWSMIQKSRWEARNRITFFWWALAIYLLDGDSSDQW